MQCGEQAQLNFSFRLCLDFSGLRIYCKAEKENGVTARRSTLLLSECLSSPIATFFSDLKLEALVVDKKKESRKRERGLQRALPLPLGERHTLDVDEACEINVKGIMALLLAQQ